MNTRFGLLFGAVVFAACGAASADQATMPTDMDVVTVTAKTPEQVLADAILASARATTRPETTEFVMPDEVEVPAITLEPIIASAPTASKIG